MDKSTIFWNTLIFGPFGLQKTSKIFKGTINAAFILYLLIPILSLGSARNILGDFISTYNLNLLLAYSIGFAISLIIIFNVILANYVYELPQEILINYDILPLPSKIPSKHIILFIAGLFLGPIVWTGLGRLEYALKGIFLTVSYILFYLYSHYYGVSAFTTYLVNICFIYMGALGVFHALDLEYIKAIKEK